MTPIPHYPPALAPTTNLVGPKGICVHTTGAGVHASAHKHGRNVFDHTVRLYSENMAEGPHFVLDSNSLQVAQIQYLDRRAHHVGTLQPGRLQEAVPYAWWNGSFPQLKRVGHHPLWYTGSVNMVTWGIEVIPPAGNPGGPWAPDAEVALRDLLRRLLTGAEGCAFTLAARKRKELEAPLRTRAAVDRFTIATHSELSPYTRTTKAGLPWDPAPAQAAQLDEIVNSLRKELQT